jgi:hypothetical protein
VDDLAMRRRRDALFQIGRVHLEIIQELQAKPVLFSRPAGTQCSAM